MAFIIRTTGSVPIGTVYFQFGACLVTARKWAGGKLIEIGELTPPVRKLITQLQIILLG